MSERTTQGRESRREIDAEMLEHLDMLLNLDLFSQEADTFDVLERMDEAESGANREDEP